MITLRNTMVSEQQDNKLENKTAIKLGSRLETIASLVPAGARIGDIGTDHAYLPVYLVQAGVICQAVGVDVHRGPYESAVENVKAYGLQDNIQIRHGDGLIPLESGEVDTLVIAGMGGVTILEILATKPDVLQSVQTLILQPQGAENRVRFELLSEGWRLSEECLTEEDGRLYTVICLSRSEGLDREEVEQRMKQVIQDIAADCTGVPGLEAAKDLEQTLRNFIWQLGPLIIERKEPRLNDIIADTTSNLRRVVLEMMRTNRAAVSQRAEQMRQEIAMMEVIKRWLYQ
ncbi:tRNA (adenine(22)-N(1))-methyltransferase TrmK [Dehalobacter sp. TBBPA1]|uniref:tRNA (adenine(22)-N(1))-methyltransferase n=1 Tax=Dehalobacter sp. TBBPA1 TaxID=3235037 RepID=UPI0034A3DC66